MYSISKTHANVYNLFDPEEWVRPVMKRDKQVLLHWGYFPDRFVLQSMSNHTAVAHHKP